MTFMIHFGGNFFSGKCIVDYKYKKWVGNFVLFILKALFIKRRNEIQWKSFCDNYNEIWGARVYSIADDIEEMTLSAQSLS